MGHNPRRVAPPVETRTTYQRDEARRALIEACCRTESGQDFVDALRSIEDAWEWREFAWWLGQALAVPNGESYPYRQAKQAALSKEKQRRTEAEQVPR